MPTTYLGRTILTAEEFYAERDTGWFNPRAMYETYLDLSFLLVNTQAGPAN